MKVSEDVLLNIEVVLIDASQPFTKFREVVGSLADPKPADIVTGNFGRQNPVVSNVLLDRAILVIAANDRVA
jgi:hypothetical protein